MHPPAGTCKSTYKYSEHFNTCSNRPHYSHCLNSCSTMPTTTSITAATSSTPSTRIGLLQIATASAPAMYSNVGCSNISTYAMPLPMYQPSYSLRVAPLTTATCTSYAHAVPTFLPPLSASQPCCQQFMPPQFFTPPLICPTKTLITVRER